MSVSTKQQRIAELARKHEAIFTLHQHMDVGWLAEAFTRLKRNSATGVDGQTVAEYESRLGLRLPELLNRIKSGRYFAPPVKRVYIPKDANEKRPIGMPTTEDKLVQRAGVMLIEPIYETEFYDWSFGFRPGRSAHQALRYLWKNLMDIGGGWVLDVDIRKFFDSIDHGQLRAVLDRRVRDGVVRKLIDKWLKAGVLEEGKHSFPEAGTPQGGVISPLLANIFLHDVLDRWFAKDVKPRLKGRAFMVRYADDFVMGFELKEDADRVMAVLPKRLAKHGLQMHTEKSRLVPFNRPRAGGKRDEEQTQTFDFLGFTHCWGMSRKGRWTVMQRTSAKRFRRGIKAIVEWCRANHHERVADQHKQLSIKLKGHFAYYGITGNASSLSKFRDKVKSWWAWWLNRRDRARGRKFDDTARWLNANFPLPPAKVVHSYVT